MDDSLSFGSALKNALSLGPLLSVFISFWFDIQIGQILQQSTMDKINLALIFISYFIDQ